jgi:uncharacterized protein (TIGR03437 family)
MCCVLQKTVFCLALLSATAGLAQSSGFLLGVSYSQWTDPTACQIGADGSGAVYVLSACYENSSIVTKVSADGTRVVWQNNLGFAAYLMAVDPGGGVYVASVAQSGQTSTFVEKLNSGTGFVWQTPFDFIVNNIAVDSTGRVFVASFAGGYVVRLNAAGTVDYTTTVTGQPTGIAVDPTGADLVVGIFGPTLAWISPDTNVTVYSTPPQIERESGVEVVVAPGGDAIVTGVDSSRNSIVERLAPGGALRFSEAVPGSIESYYSGLAVDAGGNAYVTSYGGPVLRPVKNSLAPCGTSFLSVIAPDGSILQTTYVPGGSNNPYDYETILVATSPNSIFLLVYAADPGFLPSQTSALPSDPTQPTLLLNLSQNPSARTYPLACVGSSATYGTGAIAPGEIVTLFGNGLGPEQGVQTTATMQTPYPTRESNVEVTFNGTPAPLLWVQDGQINAAVPWSLAGQASTQVCVSYNTVKTNCLTLGVTEAVPGVFMADSTYAAALNPDGTVNSAANPAQFGSTVSIFATGLGPLNPPQADGTLVGTPLPVNALPISFDIDTCFSIPCAGPPTPVAIIYGGPALAMIARMSEISFPATASNLLYLSVQPPSGQVFSNFFQVHVAQ